MVNIKVSSKINNLYCYLTEGQRTLIIIIGLLIIPAIFFTSFNFVKDGGPIDQSNIEVEILEKVKINVGQHNFRFYWVVRYDIDDNVYENFIFYIKQTNEVEMASYSIRDMVLVKIDENGGGHFYALNDRINLPFYTVLEIRKGLFWDNQDLLLKIFFIFNLFPAILIRREFDRKMRIYNNTQDALPIKFQYEAFTSAITECDNCTQEFQSGQIYCDNCGSSLRRCIICYQKPKEYQIILILECCETYAHKNHILNWFDINHRCPNCQYNKPTHRIISIFPN